MGAERGAIGERADPRVGGVVAGSYRLDSWLADGDLGPVYDAERIADGTRVALKLLTAPGLHAADLSAQLRLECALLRKVAHPNVVQVLDVGAIDDGTPFVVMECLVGETLADRMARSTLLATEALRIAIRVASALSAAHRQGVVHAALRPRDIFLARVADEPDMLKVLGFGLGRLSSEHSRITVRVQPGEAAYFAPEQLKTRGRVDHRADQFALAAITYEMLTGQPPFGADSPEQIARRIASEEPTPPSRQKSDVPNVIDPVLARALKKDPLERYGNMSQLGQALENAAAASSIQTRLRRPTPSSGPAASVYRVRPSDVGHARTEPAPAFLEELRAGEEAADSPAPRSERLPSSGVSESLDRARRLAAAARESAATGDLDVAVTRAEELFAHAIAHQTDPRVVDVLRMHFALLDRIFLGRLGDLERRVVPGPMAEPALRPELAPAAYTLLDRARDGVALRELVERARMPRRDAIRLIAGLLRRRVLDVQGG